MMFTTTSRSLGVAARVLTQGSTATAVRVAGPSVVVRQQRALSQSSRVSEAAAAAKTPATADASVEAGDATAGDAKKTNHGAPSSCVAGTALSGLGIFKDRGEPVAKPDSDYPEWLWTLLSETVARDDGIKLQSTEGLSKGEVRAVEKRNLRIIRAAKRAQQMKEAALAKAALEQGVTTEEVGLSAQGAAASAAESEHAWSEREKKRELRKANRAAIKTTNFVKAQ